MVGRKYIITGYLTLLKLACILLKNEVYNAGPTTQGGTHSPNFFLQKLYFFSLHFSHSCATISDLDLIFNVFSNFSNYSILPYNPGTLFCRKIP